MAALATASDMPPRSLVCSSKCLLIYTGLVLTLLIRPLLMLINIGIMGTCYESFLTSTKNSLDSSCVIRRSLIITATLIACMPASKSLLHHVPSRLLLSPGANVPIGQTNYIYKYPSQTRTRSLLSKIPCRKHSKISSLHGSNLTIVPRNNWNIRAYNSVSSSKLLMNLSSPWECSSGPLSGILYRRVRRPRRMPI
jgi:hypothetical protein